MIVTPSYNMAWASRPCIASVQPQVVVDYEHLIIDGGSTDGTDDDLIWAEHT